MTHSKLTQIAAATLLSCTVAGHAALADYTPISTIDKTIEIAGQSAQLKIMPTFAIHGEEGVVKVDMNALVDASDLQGSASSALNKRWKYEECGERFNTSGATVTPMADGRLHIGITAQAQKWQCIKTKVPKTYSKMVKIGFAKIKVPEIRWVMETMKTKLISQSIRVEAAVLPVIDGDRVSAEVKVTKAMPSGLAKTLVGAFGLHGKIKGLVQRELNQRLGGKHYRLPAQMQAYDARLNAAKFVDLGNGKLGLRLEASGAITQAQLATMINERLAQLM